MHKQNEACKRLSRAVAERDPTPAPSRTHGWFGYAYLLIFVAGLGFFLLSYVALAVLPGLRLTEKMESVPQSDIPPYTASELRGRRVYASLGCALCHTQQVRFLPADVRRWGAPTAAWETRYDYPQVWGTRRIGPDLARESRVRSKDWQLTHLFNPQSIVPDSVMPAFPWLFNGRPDRPTAAATDLLAYLQTLGRARANDGKRVTDDTRDSGMDPAMLMQITNLCAAPFINPQQARVDDHVPVLGKQVASRNALHARGRTLYAQNCAGCHGVNGDGQGPAAVGLMPRPSPLRVHRYSAEGLAQWMWNGVAGSAMPAWRDLSATDLASLIVYVQSLHDNTPEPARPPAPVLARGATVYAQHCLACHGVEGDGKGAAARVYLPRPANFTTTQPDTARIVQVLNEGVPGTGMPAWPDLSAADRQAVTAFVRTLFKPKADTP